MIRILVTAASSDLAKSLLEVASQKCDISILSCSRGIGVTSTEETSARKHINGIDLLDEEKLTVLAEAASEFFDGPFSIIHFAGNYWRHKPLVHTKFSEIREMFESHYLTLCGVARYLTPIMLDKGGGRLVALSCNSVIYNYPDLSPFTSAKAAVESFIKSYANEYAPYGIAATAIALPTMRTEKVIADKVDGDHENYISPEEFAHILLDQVICQNGFISGNINKLFKHSESFYHESYFSRNPRSSLIR